MDVVLKHPKITGRTKTQASYCHSNYPQDQNKISNETLQMNEKQQRVGKREVKCVQVKLLSEMIDRWHRSAFRQWQHPPYLL